MRPRPELLAALARRVLAVFFRRFEVVGQERVPRDRPLLVVANHVNGLIDPLMVLGPLPVPPRFLGKSTLWKIPILKPFLALAGVIPVVRQQDVERGEGDPGSRRSANEVAFEKAYEVLGDGGAIALFPEGKSHSEPSLQPLKTGAARILLEAERRVPGLGVRIVPVGLHFDRKQKFRSRAFVLIGDAVDPAAEVESFLAGDQGAARRLTERIDGALRSVTVSVPSWEEARLIARAGEVWRRDALGLPRRPSLGEAIESRRTLRAGYLALRERAPAAVARVAEAVDDYDQLLEDVHLSDAQVAADYPVSPVVRFVVATAGRLVLHLPLAVVGTLLNVLPYQLVGAIAHRVGRKAPDLEATYKLLGSIVLYPLFWGAEAGLARLWLGPGWGLAVLAACPLAGFSALKFWEGGRRFVREARAFLLLRTRAGLLGELRARRAAVVSGLDELAALLPAAVERREADQDAPRASGSS